MIHRTRTLVFAFVAIIWPPFNSDSSHVHFRPNGSSPSSPPEASQSLRIISVSTSGVQGNGESHVPTISGSGRLVAFQSVATTLVPGDANGTDDVFVHDAKTGITERISVSSSNQEGNGPSFNGAISRNGQFITFQSAATNLVSGDGNLVVDQFLRDRSTGVTTRISVSTAGVEANGSSGNSATTFSAISGDGRFVAFESLATNLVKNDTNDADDIFLRDTFRSTTRRISVGNSGQQADGPSSLPAVSSDGRIVAFHSVASNLVPGDGNAFDDVFVYDRLAQTLERVSVAMGGTEPNGPSTNAALNSDGRFVAFLSSASNLVPGDANGKPDVFVRDRLMGVTTRVSVSSDGTEANALSYRPEISGSGRFVGFRSRASNLVPDDTNDTSDTFLHDRQAHTTVRASTQADGGQANGTSTSPSISDNDGFIVFPSHASNLVPGDINDQTDVFRRGIPF